MNAPLLQWAIAKCTLTLFKSAALATVLTISFPRPILAQIVPDASLGENPSSAISQSATRSRIEGGLIHDTSLFHSFVDFNIDAENSVYFANPVGIKTIFTRVTGDNPSNLFGTLGVLGSADLFFLNPNGIVFGSDSSLDMGGSFIASTAAGLVFNEEVTFSATEPEIPPLLTVVVPTGLQFGQQPMPILYQAERASLSEGLIVQPGRTLALLGGELNLTGGDLQTTRGRIELGSVAEAGSVDILPDGQGWAFDYSDIETFGDLSATLSFISIASEFGSLDPRQESMTESSGNIVVQAADVTLSRSTLIRTGTRTDIRAGDITLNARNLDMSGGSQLSSGALASTPEDIQGSAGNIAVNASGVVTVQGALDFIFAVVPTGIRADVRGENIDRDTGLKDGVVFGDSGNIVINTRQLRILEGAVIAAGSNSAGDSGSVIVNAEDSVEVIGFFAGENQFSTSSISTSTLGGTGAGGTLQINTGDLLLQDAGTLFSAADGSGPGGSITVNADSVKVSGGVPVFGSDRGNEAVSGITASAEAEGDAGQIEINARTVHLRSGGRLTTETLPESTGNGNLITVTATEDIRVEGVSPVNGRPSGLLARTQGTGDAGELQLETDELRVEAGGEISAATLNETAQSAGSIKLRGNRVLLNQGRFTVETFAEAGDNAEISISGLALLLLRNGSTISAEAFGRADGGNVRIEASNGFLVASPQENSDIVARAALGNGGNIEVLAQNILGFSEGFAIPGSETNDIDASSQFGLSGTVALIELNVEPIQESEALPETTGAPRISQRCNPGEGISSFVATGRGGIPIGPENVIVSPEIWEELYVFEPTAPSDRLTTSSAPSIDFPQISETLDSNIVEAQGWQRDAAGKVELIADIAPANNVLSATRSQTGCSFSGVL